MPKAISKLVIQFNWLLEGRNCHLRGLMPSITTQLQVRILSGPVPPVTVGHPGMTIGGNDRMIGLLVLNFMVKSCFSQKKSSGNILMVHASVYKLGFFLLCPCRNLFMAQSCFLHEPKWLVLLKEWFWGMFSFFARLNSTLGFTYSDDLYIKSKHCWSLLF